MEILDIKQIYSSVTGPLARLEANAVGGALQYPSNLGSEYRDHFVQFDILKYDIGTGGPADVIVDRTEKLTSGLGASLKTAVNGEFEAALKQLGKTAETTFSSVQVKPTEKIVLYTPDTLDFSQSSHYNETSYAKMIQDAKGVAESSSITGKVVSGVAGIFDPSDTAKLLLSKMGYAFNPQMQLLFDGIDFRTYSMTFTFTPYSKQEADNVRQIINKFRFHAAPKVFAGAAGFFFESPSVFDIKFFSGKTENKFINRVHRSVLESVNVNYAPNGWSAHVDGAPTQMTMQLNFKEIELLDRNKIQQDLDL